MLQTIALIASIILPLWNIPLIARVIKRKSSSDISLYWAIGVWSCFALMAPAGFMSVDIVWKVFTIINFIFFSLVVVIILVYR